MSRFPSFLTIFLALGAVLPCASGESATQNIVAPDSQPTGVVLIKLSAPVYPPVARQAHITGDVDLMLSIRQDGSIESAVVVSGPPMLRSVALDSAQHAQFECRTCSEAINSYRLVYTFQIDGDCSCIPKESNSNHDEPDHTYPLIAEAEHRVTVTAQIICTCDPASDFRKRRSIRCLYLWRCGP